MRNVRSPGALVYDRLPISWLRLRKDGNAQKGGYMRHLWKYFIVKLPPAEGRMDRAPVARARGGPELIA